MFILYIYNVYIIYIYIIGIYTHMYVERERERLVLSPGGVEANRIKHIGRA